MKTISKSWVAAVAGVALGLTCFSARGELEVSAGISINAVGDFYGPLTSGGVWVDVGSYGRCWRPTGVAADWRPYCNGSWEWTDNGWYWQTDEPFGWACYHYGSWVYDPVRFWVWVPGVEWAPAWVAWRHGGGYVGWAPLGPGHVVVEGPQFVFVQEGHFHEPVRRSAVVVNNTTVINKTVVINNVRQENRGSVKVVVNEGPGLAAMQKATGNKIKSVSISAAVQRTVVPAEVKRAKVEKREEARPAVSREANPAESKRPEPKRPEPNRAEPIQGEPRGIATEPPVERAPAQRPERREEVTPPEKPAKVDRAPAEERTRPLERVNPEENKALEQKRLVKPAAKRPVAPRPPVEKKPEIEKKPEGEKP